MLRNNLITLLGEKGNDVVVADVAGIHIEVVAVTTARDAIALLLDPEELRATLDQMRAAGTARVESR